MHLYKIAPGSKFKLGGKTYTKIKGSNKGMCKDSKGNEYRFPTMSWVQEVTETKPKRRRTRKQPEEELDPVPFVQPPDEPEEEQLLQNDEPDDQLDELDDM